MDKGFAFPPRLDADGRWAWVEGTESIRESIRVILSTSPGERRKLPGFGAGLRNFLYEPNTATTRRLIQESVTRALQKWEKRIWLTSVSVEPDPADLEAAVVSVSFRVLATGADERFRMRLSLAPAGDE
ncbi:MAG TPA: GPW/gp25 family protein [Symbiobacteriaceae bacterium]|nr:GPW/gp25 family protein [Symbiobacteriaceae bacterium]